MTIFEMTNRSNMVEVKVRKHFSGRMLTPGRPISRILCAQVALRRWPSIWDWRLRQPRAANPGA